MVIWGLSQPNISSSQVLTVCKLRVLISAAPKQLQDLPILRRTNALDPNKTVLQTFFLTRIIQFFHNFDRTNILSDTHGTMTRASGTSFV